MEARHGLLITLALLAVGAALPNPAQGSVGCGDTIKRDKALTHDVGPCSGDGLIMGKDGIVLDLRGHDVIGEGEGVGIALGDLTGVTVKSTGSRGEVSKFDAGVAISGGSQNSVRGLTLRKNLGPGNTDFGDGVSISDSTGNLVKDNRVVNNGPFSGISVVGDASVGNMILANRIMKNTFSVDPAQSQTDGIRLENLTGPTIVRQNVVKGSGLDGISLFANSSGNTVSGNVLSENGSEANSIRAGSGIIVFQGANSNQITSNEVRGSAASGIEVRNMSTSNTLTSNLAKGNNTASLAGAFDLLDANAACDSNVWTGSTFGTRSQTCIE
jgi:parallel beta-helix repeat protein